MVITEKIMQCSLCKMDGNIIVRPFCFKLRKQPIMVISACPSIQTVYKPITSIRFFRQLCLSLLGINGISEKAVKEFNSGSIYWTHYHKCYFSAPNQKNRLNNLPDKCANNYLEEEIIFLKDNIKVIIVIGKSSTKKHMD